MITANGAPACRPSLERLGVDVQASRLPAGDYVVSDRLVVERKSPTDLAASIKDRRLFEQLARLADGLLGWGTFLFLILSLFIFIIYFFNVTAINAFKVRDPKPMGNDALAPDALKSSTYVDEGDNWPAILSGR